MKKLIGIYEAKASLSKLIQAVRKHGVTFQISDRGKPVAQLVPVPTSESLDDRMRELIQSGDLVSSQDSHKLTPIDKKPGALKRFLAERE